MTSRSVPRSRSTAATPSADDDRQGRDSRRRSYADSPPPVLQRIQDFRSPDDVRFADQQVPAAASKDSAIARLLLDGRRPMLLLQQQQQKLRQHTTTSSTPSTPRSVTASHQSLKPTSPIVDVASLEGHGHRRVDKDDRHHRHCSAAPGDQQRSPIVDFSAKKSPIMVRQWVSVWLVKLTLTCTLLVFCAYCYGPWWWVVLPSLNCEQLESNLLGRFF